MLHLQGSTAFLLSAGAASQASHSFIILVPLQMFQLFDPKTSLSFRAVVENPWRDPHLSPRNSE